MRHTVLSLAAVVLVTACGTEPGAGVDAAVDSTGDIGALDADSILTFVNGPDATVARLIGDVRIQRRTALSIVGHVRGADFVLGTADDRPLASIAELDGLRYVGPATIAALKAYVRAHYQSDDLVVEGVALSSENAAAIVELANTATLSTLDDDVGLDARAARAIVAARPLLDINAVAAVSYVGQTALTHLRDWVITHPSSSSGSGTMPAAAVPIPLVLEWINDYRVATGHVTRLNLNRDGTYDATVAGAVEHGVFFGPATPPQSSPLPLRLVAQSGAVWTANLTMYSGTSAETERDGAHDVLAATLPTDGEDMCGTGGGNYSDDDANADGLYCTCDGGKSWIPALGGCVL